MVAGGAVLGGLATTFVMSRFGPLKLAPDGVTKVAKGPTEFVLPGMTSKFGPLLYAIAIPVIGAFALRKAQPKLSQGMVIGGAVLLIQNVMDIATKSLRPTTGVGAYLNAGGTLRSLPSPGYSGIRAFGNSLDSGSAFRSNTWALAR